jgi:hypothetical protein
MWISIVTPLALLLLFVPSAFGASCVLNGPRHQLKSDTVDWTMQISSGQRCVRGLRYSHVTIDTVKLIVPPLSGHVVMLGPGFSYKARSGFQGQDSFTILVSGTANRIRGSSTIRIVVSVGGN